MLEDLGVVHVGDQVLRFFAELVDLLRLSQVLNECFFALVVVELLLLNLQKEVLQVFCDPRCCYRFPLQLFESLDGPPDDLASWFCRYCVPCLRVRF